MRKRTIVVTFAAILVSPALAQDNIGHERHHHRHGEPHATEAPTPARFITNRGGATLELPREDDAFFFVVFGDRTGGPATGVSVLADAVRDTNLLEPDLVMTVGDLIQGYNQTPQWMDDMREFKGIMDNLLCPWFPVAGNHDIYWRGENKPDGEHERSYEMHFGPLWYAFTHKNCMFIALYTDEGDPNTGEKAINKPNTQVMSQEQLDWLKQTLAKGSDLDHIFVFLHHPRWLRGNYGDDWDKVHKKLVAAGNVSAVFAGHIHRLRYDPKDGIEYITLATAGGAQSGAVPQTGWLHHFNVVTVRKDQVAHASVPVGEVMDVREITGEVGDEALRLSRARPTFSSPIALDNDASGSGTIEATIRNPTSHPIDATLMIDSADARWLTTPDHNHARLEPGVSRTFSFQIERMPGLDRAFRTAELVLETDMLLPGHRYSIPQSRSEIPMSVTIEPPTIPDREFALDVDGRSGRVEIPSSSFSLPDGPFTLECWFNADRYADRTGLLAKTENSEYGFFVNNGRPSFSVLIGPSYVEARADRAILDTGRWHHIAGVFDGRETRLYVDGRLVKSVSRSGTRRTNDLPLIIGADVNSNGDATSHFDGRVDSVRLSTGVRYRGEAFAPKRRLASDADTVLLFNMDALVGPWIYDEGKSSAHAMPRGEAQLVGTN